jgi:hypothetical protein
MRALKTAQQDLTSWRPPDVVEAVQTVAKDALESAAIDALAIAGAFAPQQWQEMPCTRQRQ